MNFGADGRDRRRGDILVAWNIHLFDTNTPHSGPTLRAVESASFEPEPGNTETGSDANRAGEKIKTQTFQQIGVSVFLLQHWRLRFKARGTQDIEPVWLGLTPLMWAAEGVRPHLDRMMKFRLYLYPHATLHHCRYDSPRSICFQGERGRWIVMYLRWPACKHSYVADHVAPLMHVKYWVGLFGVLGFSGLAFIHLFHLFGRVLRLAKFDPTCFRMTPVRLHRS